MCARAQDKASGKELEHGDKAEPDAARRAAGAAHDDLAQSLALAAHVHQSRQNEQV